MTQKVIAAVIPQNKTMILEAIRLTAIATLWGAVAVQVINLLNL